MASLDPPEPRARDTAADPLAALRLVLADAATEVHGSPATVDLRLDRPKRPEFGDFSSNAPLLLASGLGEPPRAVAERLGEALRAAGWAPTSTATRWRGPASSTCSCPTASGARRCSAVAPAGRDFGSAVAGAERILVEFVSANPTGPITVAAARHAAYGDSLCRILAFAGHRVEREYYVNDAGGQIRRFGESLAARARDEEPPADGYHGAYVAELADRIAGAAELGPDALALQGMELMLETVRATLERFRVHFDRFFSERSLHADGAIERVLERLSGGEHVYASEGATWLRTSELGDDKDRVLRRSSGELTYFAGDVAYHADKLDRGTDRVIDVLGADHHGYVARMQAAWQALGGASEGLELVIMQLVNLTEGGRRVAMSKREGEFVTLDDLIDDIGVDAARWFLLQRSHDTTLDLDLGLAREQTQENPVYYVQYAHARIAAILRRASEQTAETAARAEQAAGRAPLHASERALVRRLLEFPAELSTSAARRAPHRMTVYALELAQGFSAFYRDCRVVGAEEEGGDEAFRIALVRSVQATLARSLDLLGVEAPESM